MTPEEIGEAASRVSLTREDIHTLQEWALENGDLERAVGFAGLGTLMDSRASLEETIEPSVEETISEEADTPDTNRHSENMVMSNFRSKVKRIRGSRRPKEHQDREKYTYGSGI